MVLSQLKTRSVCFYILLALVGDCSPQSKSIDTAFPITVPNRSDPYYVRGSTLDCEPTWSEFLHERNKAAILSTIKSHMPQIEACRVPPAEPNKREGKVVAKFVINENGFVEEVSIVDNSFHDDIIESCVKSILRELTFPPLGERAPVTFPFEWR